MRGEEEKTQSKEGISTVEVLGQAPARKPLAAETGRRAWTLRESNLDSSPSLLCDMSTLFDFTELQFPHTGRKATTSGCRKGQTRRDYKAQSSPGFLSKWQVLLFS